MTTMFQKATKKESKLRMSVNGPAGSGKTYTALAIARHLGSRVAVLDTEHGSASKYADLFDFDTATLDSFSIDNYIRVIGEAERAGYDVLIIDSLSHAWAGKDGALEEVDRLKRASRSGDAFTQGWSQVTPKQTRLIDTILGCNLHIIATMRTKTAYEIAPDERGKMGPRKVGTAPVQRDGVEYEFDVVGDMDPDHIMRITKTRCVALTDRAFDRPGADVADILKAWLGEGQAPVAGIVNAATGAIVDSRPAHPTAPTLPADWDAFAVWVNEALPTSARYENAWHVRQAIASQLNAEHADDPTWKPLDGKKLKYPTDAERIHAAYERAVGHAQHKIALVPAYDGGVFIAD